MFDSVWPVAVGLLLLITANIALGSCSAWIAGKFDTRALLRGVVKGLIIAACMTMTYAAGQLNQTVYFVLSGANVTLTGAMTVLMASAYGVYAAAVLKKLYGLFNLDTSGGGSAG